MGEGGGEVKDPIKVANIMGGAQSWLGFFEKGTSGQGGGQLYGAQLAQKVWGPILLNGALAGN